MQQLGSSYFPDIKTVLINRLPHLSETEIDVILDVFMCM